MEVGNTFDRLKNSVNRGFTTLSLKTSSTIEKSKIKMHIETIERENGATLSEIGKQAYSMWSKNAFDPSAFEEKFQSIKTKLDEIEKLVAEMNAIDERDSKILGSMASTNTIGTETPKQYFCPQCGTPVEGQINFCGKCGHKF